MEGGLETAHNLPRWSRFVSKTEKTEPLFVPKPLNPLLNSKVFHTSAEPNAVANAQSVRRSTGSTLHRGGSQYTPTHHNHAYVGAKASVQINISAKLLHMDSILQEAGLCLCRPSMTNALLFK